MHAQQQAHNARVVQVEHVQDTIQGVVGRLVDQVIAGHELRVQGESDQQRSADNKQSTTELAAQVAVLEEQEKEVCCCCMFCFALI